MPISAIVGAGSVSGGAASALAAAAQRAQTATTGHKLFGQFFSMYCKSASRSASAFSQSVLGGASGSASIIDNMNATFVSKVGLLGSFGLGGSTFFI
jgi:hypothetical protein